MFVVRVFYMSEIISNFLVLQIFSGYYNLVAFCISNLQKFCLKYLLLCFMIMLHIYEYVNMNIYIYTHTNVYMYHESVSEAGK